MKLKSILLAGAAVVAVSGAALAADPIMPTPVVPVAPIPAAFDWNGFYAGVHVGAQNSVTPSTTDWLLGGEIGVNAAYDMFVMGAELAPTHTPTVKLPLVPVCCLLLKFWSTVLSVMALISARLHRRLWVPTSLRVWVRNLLSPTASRLTRVMLMAGRRPLASPTSTSLRSAPTSTSNRKSPQFDQGHTVRGVAFFVCTTGSATGWRDRAPGQGGAIGAILVKS